MLELLEVCCLYLWENILFLEMSLFWIYCKLLLIQILQGCVAQGPWITTYCENVEIL